MTEEAYKKNPAGAVARLWVTMQDSGDQSLLCFPQFNSSCRKKLRSPYESLLTSTALFGVTLLTVTLNLLVIVSFYNFR